MSAIPTPAALARLRMNPPAPEDVQPPLTRVSSFPSSSSTSSPALLSPIPSATNTSASSTPSSSTQPSPFSSPPSSSSSPSAQPPSLPSSVLTPPLAVPTHAPHPSAAPLSLVPPYYDPELFTTPPPDHLVCAICTGVVHSPLNLSCSHLFCASCLAQWCQAQAQTQLVEQVAAAAAAAASTGTLTTPSSTHPAHPPSSTPLPLPSASSPSTTTSPTPPIPSTHACPTCRAPFSLFLASPNHAIQHVIANMEVRCPNHDAGCPIRLQMGLRERNVIAHRRRCPWEKVRCRYAPECRVVGERRDMERHERVECSERMRECDECGEFVKCGEWDAHRASAFGCVGLMLCPHRCRTEPGRGEEEEEEEVAVGTGGSRKKNRTADDEQGKEEEHRLAALQPFHSPSASTTPSSTPPVSSPSTSSPPRAARLELSAPSSPTPQLFVSTKRKFGIMTNPAHLSAATPINGSSSSSSSSSSSTPSSSSSSPAPFTVIRRSTLAAHLAVCPLRPIQCDLCPARVLRSGVEAHFQANLASHLIALQRSHRSEQLKSDLLLSELSKLRKENSDMRREVGELSRQVCSPPLFAFFFDIAPLSLLCSHYISNDFVCGDHSYYFALHRQGNFFSAFVYLKTGATPVRLSYVLMVKQRKQPHRTAASSPAPPSPSEQRVDGEVDGLLEHDAAAVVGPSQPPLSLSPVTSLVSSSSSSAFSSPSPPPFSPSPVSLRVKLDVEYKAAEGKGIANWFTLVDLTERGGYAVEEDAITIGVLIKDHSSAWVYSAADALYPSLPAAASRAAAHSGLDVV